MIALLVYLVTQDFTQSCFWIFYLLGSICDAISNSDFDGINFD